MQIDVVAIVLSVVAFTVWLSRLEAKTNTNSRDLEKAEKAREASETELKERMGQIEAEHSTLNNKLMDKLNSMEVEMTERLSRIEGKLNITNPRRDL